MRQRVHCTLIMARIVVPIACEADEAAPQCKRPAVASDIFIDAGGEDVTILLANVADNCAVVFPNNLRVKRDADNRDPWYVYIRAADMDGNVLTHVKDNSLPPGRLVVADGSGQRRTRDGRRH